MGDATIEAFLTAAANWAEDSGFGKEQGKEQGMLGDNPWCNFATFLYCGKIYE